MCGPLLCELLDVLSPDLAALLSRKRARLFDEANGGVRLVALLGNGGNFIGRKLNLAVDWSRNSELTCIDGASQPFNFLRDNMQPNLSFEDYCQP